MYLEKLEIQGFKSFANKNVLIFPGMLDQERRGITAVVGPNGSGKSNIADSVRWVLGEQSMKQLRGKKSEDVIFSGSEKAGKLGMAEVSMYLNNEDKKAPIDYAQVVLTRRLYRDGASEYLINNNRVRLIDIQMLLAKASFGQRTYSVIGQGMVEGFLNTTLAERKEFFDEATGVKQFQIKRDDSLNKLISSYENLMQVDMLLSEIEPRLKSLTRQVNKLQRRGEIEAELEELQLNFYSKLWHDNNDKFNEFNSKYLELEKSRLDKDRKLEALNKKLDQLEVQNEITEEFNGWQRELSSLQAEKDQITKQTARLEAEMEVKLEAAGKFDLSWLSNKKSELKQGLLKIEDEIRAEEEAASEGRRVVVDLTEEQKSLQAGIQKLNQELREARSFAAAGGNEKVNKHLDRLILKLEAAEIENDFGRVKTLIKEIKTDLKKILEAGGGEAGKDLERLEAELNSLALKKEEAFLKLGEAQSKASAQNERLRFLKEKKSQMGEELAAIVEKLERYEDRPSDAESDKRQKGLKEKLDAVEKKIADTKEKIGSFSRAIEEKRSRIFELQKNSQALQNEINQINNELNEIKVGSTRYETRLEDLEAEIRNELGSLKEVKELKVGVHLEMETLKEKIENLKRQLDQIGGIDPEIEKEYAETKERFDFLSGQTGDLKKAIESLEKIIKELDIVIKERFDKEFKTIQQKFEEYFKILFNGGAARIIKVMAQEEEASANPQDKKGEKGAGPADGSEEERKTREQESNLKKIKYLQRYNATGLAGIEIQATPPGKKIGSISMLSGGERALTAIAMICAIISVNPSPFVILDEVDAALDEANSERLAKILDDLSHKTQFIVITHNRASMRRANVLYGVTMQEDGVSKLLSVKLDEIKTR